MSHAPSTMNRPPCCTPRSLPVDLHVAAAFDAMIVRADNVPPVITEMANEPIPLHPLQIAMQRGRYWRPAQQLRVAFRGGDADTNAKVIAHGNAWLTPGVPVPVMVGVPITDEYDVLVGYDEPGYWCYIGTDCRMVPRGQLSLCLQGFDSGQMPESEWRRVVRHETGHLRGALHEQLRPEVVRRLDPAKVIPWGQRTQGWPPEMSRRQMLDAMNMATVDATPVDVRSIMEYEFSGELTYDGQPIPGGDDIDAFDRQGMALAYGGSVGPVDPPSPPPHTRPLLVGGPRVSDPAPLRLLVAILKSQRLTLLVDVTLAHQRAPAVTIASEGPGELTPMKLEVSHVAGQGLPMGRTDDWPPGRYIVTVAHPDGTPGARAYARLAPAGAP